ncbi:MAG: hypothetical protein QM681_01490 [Novosphingobium sp.]
MAIFDAAMLQDRFPPHLLAAISTSWEVHRAQIIRTCMKGMPLGASPRAMLKSR